MTEERDAELWLVRHGETEWSRDGRHTSVTDLDLTERGVDVARSLRDRRPHTSFDLVVSSPRSGRSAPQSSRASTTSRPTRTSWSGTTPRLRGRHHREIRETVPGWTVWTHPTPGGEKTAQVTERLDRVVAKVREAGERVLVFGHGHSLRALTARWIEQPVEEGRFFARHRDREHAGLRRDFPVVLRWNT